MTAPVAFVDTETLGLDADHQPVWEVALILPNGNEVTWVITRTQREFGLAHPIALEMMGDRYSTALADGMDVEESQAIREFAALTDGLHLAGAVVSFDEERLRRMAWRHGVPIWWHYHLIDVEALAVGFLAGREAAAMVEPPWKSDELTAALGITIAEDTKHTALGDARWAKAIYDAVMA